MIWILCVFTFFFSSCDQKPQESQYKEIVLQAPQVNTPSISNMSHLFTWDIPSGWEQEAGSGMRLATLHLISDDKAIDCSLVVLGGMAGSLEANLRRWMGQIGVQATPDELTALISSAPSTKIKTGQEGRIFDLSSIRSKAKPADKSMVVVMITLDQATLFVKMSGTVDTIGKNKEDFLKLVASIVYHV